MLISRYIVTVLLMLIFSSGLAAKELEIEHLSNTYASTVAESGKMSEQANKVREKIIDYYFGRNVFSPAVPYLRDSWEWSEHQEIKGPRKGKLRFQLEKALKESEVEQLKKLYATAIAESGKMSEQANEVREEIIDHYYDDKIFAPAVPYLRDAWVWYEQQDIRGPRKGKLRFKLGKALRVAGYFQEAQPFLEKAYEKVLDKKGDGHRVTIIRAIQYGVLLSNLGQHEKAIEILKKYLQQSENIFGENHGKTAYAHMQLGAAYQRVSNVEPALKNLKAAYEIFVYKKGSDSKHANLARLKLAKLFRSVGKLDKSEQILRKAYVEFASKYKNQSHQLAAHLMTHLGRTLMEQGRFVEAEQLLKDGIEKKKTILGKDSEKTIQTMLTLIKIYLEQDKFKEAEKTLLEIAAFNGGIKDLSRSGARRNILLGRTMRELGELDKAEQAYSKVKSFLEFSPDAKQHNAAYQLGMGLLHHARGQYVKAAPYLVRGVELTGDLYGEGTPRLSKAKSFLANNYAKQGDYEKAVVVYREVMNSNAGFLENRKTFSLSGRAQQEAAAQRYLFSYMELMIDAYQKGIKVDAEPILESFAIAENSRSKSLQAAMLGQTARAAARNEYLSDLVRKEQNIRVQLGGIEEAMIEYVSSSAVAGKRRGKLLEEQRRELNIELRKIGEEMSYQYPEYSRLINPTATELKVVQDTLASGELMLAYFVQKQRTLIWAIDKDKAILHVSNLSEKDIYARVQKIRSGLDLPIATVEDIPTYNLKLAHELYNELIAPAGKQLEGVSNLIIVPHKALLSMPFGALVSSNTKLKKGTLPFSEYKAASWLAQKYAISIMPSATALVTMRTYAKHEPAEQPFIGFGDPVFTDRDDSQDDDVVTTRGIRVAQRSAFNTRSLKGLPNLPETREELEKIALSLGASKDNIYLGNKASENSVKNASLNNFRVVAFATHGLVADDLEGLEQPALALTPPEQADEENDGLLTMGEVLELDLNADWVVLSACNTASGDKSLANEGLTGLTQAFFYAGSRALLVSLWPVESTSTQELTTTMFSAAIKDGTLGRAASLQAARKRLIEGAGYTRNGKELFSYAHPIFWAAFIAVGEGGLK